MKKNKTTFSQLIEKHKRVADSVATMSQYFSYVRFSRLLRQSLEERETRIWFSTYLSQLNFEILLRLRNNVK